jgi:hypothetical protein
MTQTLSYWKGSTKTADAVRDEIARRWGEEAAKEYNPLQNCFTLPTWNKLGYRVKKGEQAIRSITYVKAKDNGEQEEQDNPEGEEEPEVRKYPKPVYLFYKTQVEKRQRTSDVQTR